jgi:hypothetical protein
VHCLDNSSQPASSSDLIAEHLAARHTNRPPATDPGTHRRRLGEDDRELICVLGAQMDWSVPVRHDHAMLIEQRLDELALRLPGTPRMPPGVAATFSWVRMVGDRLLISGHGSQEIDGSPAGPFGRVPDAVTLEQAQASARQAALSVISSVQHALGDLDRVAA